MGSYVSQSVRNNISYYDYDWKMSALKKHKQIHEKMTAYNNVSPSQYLHSSFSWYQSQIKAIVSSSIIRFCSLFNLFCDTCPTALVIFQWQNDCQ